MATVAATDLEATIAHLQETVMGLRAQVEADAQRLVAAEQEAVSATARAEQRLDAELARMQARLDKAEAAVRESGPKKP